MFLRLNPPFFALRGMDSAMNDTLDELTGSCRAETAACSGPSSSCNVLALVALLHHLTQQAKIILAQSSSAGELVSFIGSFANFRVGGRRCDRPFVTPGSHPGQACAECAEN